MAPVRSGLRTGVRSLRNRVFTAAGTLLRYESSEYTIDFARALFSVTSLFAIYIDPSEPAHFAAVAQFLMLLYASHSIVLLLITREQPSGTRIRLTFVVDLVFPAIISVFSGGPHSPFFLFFVFVLFTAAHRWGFAGTFVTSCFCILSVSLQVFVYPVSAAMTSHLWKIVVIRCIYIFVLGVLIGYIAEDERRQRSDESTVNRVLFIAGETPGFIAALHAVLAEVCTLASAQRAVVAVQDANTGLLSTGELRRGESDSGIVWRQHGTRDSQTYLFLPRNEAVIFRREQEETREGGSPSPSFNARYSYVNVTAIRFDLSDSIDGCVFFFDVDERRTRKILPLLVRALRQTAATIYTAYLLEQIRSGAGAAERGRLARELHDGSIQSLAGVEMRLYVLRTTLQSEAQAGLSDEACAIQKLVHAEIVNLRHLTDQIRPMDNVTDIDEALASVVAKFRGTGIDAHYVGEATFGDISPRAARELVRIVQEALTNIRKHSSATNAIVRLAVDDGRTCLTVEDNGIGFEFAGRLSHNELQRSGQGPLVIKERARSLGAELTIESNPGRGAKIEIKLPASVAAHA